MSGAAGIPGGALVAMADMLDDCIHLERGQEVLVVADVGGLHGGDSLVDEDAVSWIASGVRARGANATVMWVDTKQEAHAWRIPPVALAAMASCDVVINNAFFDLPTTELPEFREHFAKHGYKLVRNFASTASLLTTAWAQTPYELVSEIRYQASLAFQPGKTFVLTDPNGTHLEGAVRAPSKTSGIPGGDPYSTRRGPHDNMYPWPEWVHTPVQVADVTGVYIFEAMLSWWSRYIGVPCCFDRPIEFTLEAGRITAIRGGHEADSLRRFLATMADRQGEDVYRFQVFHFGVHPQASVAAHQCPNALMRRLIDHSHCSNVHFHIGDAKPTPAYPYYLHVTADIRNATLRVGGTPVYEQGRLVALDNPAVAAVARKYPGRPGVVPAPKSF
jgi:hypothetical protein